MKKFILFICFLLLCLTLSGCSGNRKNTEKENTLENISTSDTVNEIGNKDTKEGESSMDNSNNESIENQDEINQNSDSIEPNEENISDSSSENTSDNGSTEELDLQAYSGTWTTEGKDINDIQNRGGAYLILEMNKNVIEKGSYICIQGTSQRIADVEFSGALKEGEGSFPFTDDGFGNRGTLQISFKEDRIEIEILDLVTAEDNSSGYTIHSATLQKLTESVYLNEVLDYLESVGRTDVPYDEPIFNSDTKVYSKEELMELSDNLLFIFRNEIYARHGRIFENSDLSSLFKKFSWYKETYDGNDFDKIGETLFNDMEKQNLKMVVKIENSK